jgi:hypothetical protein
MWQSEIAHQMAVIPLAFLGCLQVRGQRRDAAWWWLAGAFFVSWIADTAGDFLPQNDRWIPSMVYPVSQSALIGAVLLPRPEALYFLATLIAAGAAIVLWNGIGPDAALRTVAWLAIVWLVWRRPALPKRLRICLAVYFGLGWVAWLIHVQWLVVATYYPYQLSRLIGLLLFCWAALVPGPALRLVREPS